MAGGASTVRILDVTSVADNGIAYGFLAIANAVDAAFIQNSYMHGNTNSVRRVTGIVRIGASQLSGGTSGAPTCPLNSNFNAFFAVVACP